jgi:outer membrane protein assembly factor BamB
MFISSGYKKGGVLLDFTRGSAQEVWRAPNMCTQFSSCVLHDGHIYGIDGNTGSGTLRCLDYQSGREKWSQNLGFGSLIVADDKLIVLNEAGRLFVADASPTGYRELARCEALPAKGAKCWTAPVLCRGRLFLRNSKGDVVSLDVSK